MDNLRIFKTFDSKQSRPLARASSPVIGGSSHGSSSSREMRLRDLDSKPYKSESDILAKLKKRNSDATTAKKKVKGQKLGDGFMKEKQPIIGDVKENDPKDPMTAQKLKGVLSSGAISFSAKEKEVLSKILA